METLRCEHGHEWASDGQDTVAVCPFCGAAPMMGTSVSLPPDNPDQTIGEGSRIRPLTHDETTFHLAKEAFDGDPKRPDESVRTLDGQTGQPVVRPNEPETTLGASAEDHDQTLGLDGAGDRGKKKEELTIGISDNESEDKQRTLDLPRGATRQKARGEQTIGVDDDGDAEGVADDRTQYMPPDKGGTFKVGNDDDKTGAWDAGVAVPAPGKAPVPDRTLVVGAETPGRKAASASTDKATTQKKKVKKDPLGGKTSVAGYQILGELGRGGMGVVYKARQPGVNRIVALKMVLNSGHAGKEALLRFKIEAEAVALLQHPNIVQLYEVGEEDGCPFFSLEFVEGDSLAKKIESTPQPPGESALLVQRLAEGMQEAHQRGIIHRDLKPANILLTMDGIPKITDFGLAKRFDDLDQGHTRTGAIMGTPSYMAPEQAEGKTKETGPQADIYSLGAILYDMLTGRPPFRGSTLLETLHQVKTLEPVAPKRLQPSVPHDLQTICLKALEKDPAKRYATAGALADDLRHFHAGEPIMARPTPWYERGWKWAKRRPAVAGLIAVSILGVISLLTLGGLWLDTERRGAEAVADVERKRAADQTAAMKNEEILRKAAERNFKRAKAAVDEMLSEVGQDRLRNIPQMETVRRDLLKKAKIFYDDFMKEQSTDPDIRLEAARAQQRVADILEKLGDSAFALKAYASALELFQKLDKEYPDKKEFKKSYANVANNYGNLLKDLKRNQDAEQSYRLAAGLQEALHDNDPRDAEVSLELAKSHNNIAQVLFVLGNGKGAEAEFQAGRQILGALAVKPGGFQYQAELARTLNNLGTLQKSLGATAVSEISLTQANKILQDLVTKETEEPVHRQELAQNYFLQARVFRDTNAKKAEEYYRQSIQLRDRLVKDFPSTPVYRQDLAKSYSDLAILSQAAGRQKEADEAYDQALDMQRKIVKDYSHLPDFRRNLGSNLNNRGIMLLSTNRAKEGEAAFIEAMNIFGKLQEDNPDVPEYAMELAGTYLNLGAVWQATQPKKALDMVRQAVALREDLAKKNSPSPEDQEKLARAEGNLGLMLLYQQPQEAKLLFGKTVSIFAKLVREHASNPDYRHQLAVSHDNLGKALRLLNQPKEVETEWRSAIDLYAALVRDYQDVPGYAQELGKLYNELGIFLVSGKRLADAEKAWRDAIVVRENLVAKYADQPDYRAELGRSECNLGIMFAQAGDFDKAEKQYRKGIALFEEYEPKLTVTPAFPSYIAELIKIHENQANLMESLNKPAEAEKNWLRILDLREKLVQSFPQVPQFRLEAVANLNELGLRVLQNQKFGEAKTFYGQAVRHLKEVTKGPNVAPVLWNHLYIIQLRLATSLAGLKDHESTYQVVRELPPQAKDRQDYLAAALLARCTGLVEKDSASTKMYADLAIVLLRQAIDNGYTDAAFLSKSEDFQAIRDREDYQMILKEVQLRSK